MLGFCSNWLGSNANSFSNSPAWGIKRSDDAEMPWVVLKAVHSETLWDFPSGLFNDECGGHGSLVWSYPDAFVNSSVSDTILAQLASNSSVKIHHSSSLALVLLFPPQCTTTGNVLSIRTPRLWETIMKLSSSLSLCSTTATSSDVLSQAHKHNPSCFSHTGVLHYYHK